MSVVSLPATATQLCPAVASSTVVSAGTLAQLSHRSTAQFHAHRQSSQPTSGAGRSGQKPNVVCEAGSCKIITR